MLIRIGYDIVFKIPAPVSIIAMLYVHPSEASALKQHDVLRVDPRVAVEDFTDTFGNRCARLLAPAGALRLWTENLLEIPGDADEVNESARQWEPKDLPADTLQFLLSSRYCEVDLLSDIAWKLMGESPTGWGRVQAVCDWVHNNIQFGYAFARSTKTAYEVYQERAGVCRDFQHLAITLCRCLNIPARYATGYLGDIRVPPQPTHMDFSAWFQAYLDGRWYTFDARFNTPRIGRTLVAVGRDAVDVALTTSFGAADLTHFAVTTEEVTG